MAVGWAPFWPRWGGKPLAGAGVVGVDRVDSTRGSSPFHHFQRMSRPPHPTPLPHDHLPLPCLLLSSQQSAGCGHAGAGEPLLWPPPPPCPAWRQAAACGGPAHPGVGHHRGEPHAAALDGTGGVQRPRWGGWGVGGARGVDDWLGGCGLLSGECCGCREQKRGGGSGMFVAGGKGWRAGRRSMPLPLDPFTHIGMSTHHSRPHH